MTVSTKLLQLVYRNRTEHIALSYNVGIILTVQLRSPWNKYASKQEHLPLIKAFCAPILRDVVMVKLIKNNFVIVLPDTLDLIF